MCYNSAGEPQSQNVPTNGNTFNSYQGSLTNYTSHGICLSCGKCMCCGNPNTNNHQFRYYNSQTQYGN
jgi:hypothetical protein